jgi:hypothetical protein
VKSPEHNLEKLAIEASKMYWEACHPVYTEKSIKAAKVLLANLEDLKSRVETKDLSRIGKGFIYVLKSKARLQSTLNNIEKLLYGPYCEPLFCINFWLDIAYNGFNQGRDPYTWGHAIESVIECVKDLLDIFEGRERRVEPPGSFD